MLSSLQAKDLSRHFNHVTILASAGIDVKQQQPATTHCPYCTQECLAIYNDYLSPGSVWLRCRNCGFSGDSIETFSRLSKAKDLKDAIRLAVNQGFCALPAAAALTEAEIDQYIESFPRARNKYASIWSGLQNNVRDNLSPDMLYRLQDESLWGGSSTQGRERFVRLIGGGLKYEINRLFDHKLLNDGFNTALALNYQDVPGRISAFSFLGEKDSLLKLCVDRSRKIKEGGLALFDVLTPSEGTVYAIGNPWLALHLQRVWLSDSENPLKLVVFNDETNLAWRNVTAARTILWNDVVNWKLFFHAKNAPNAFITDHPSLKETRFVYDYVVHKSPASILNLMERHAVPWRVAFCDWLCNKNVPEYELRDAVMRLELDASERRQVIASAPREYKARVEALLGEVKTVQTAIIRNSTVLEQNDGWWLAHQNGAKELMSDAPIRIHHEINNMQTGSIYLRGVIRYRGQDLPFEEDLEQIEKDTMRWVRRIVAKAGLGCPQISPGWNANLLTVAKNFSNPTPLVGESKLGIRPTGEIVFPKFKLVNGRVINEDIPFKTINTPATDVMQPAISAQNLGKPFFQARASFMVMASVFISNMILRMRGEHPRPVAITGTDMSVGRIVARHFATVSGMKSFFLYRPTNPAMLKSIVSAIKDKLKEYDYPGLVETEYQSAHHYQHEANNDVMLLTDMPSALKLAAGSPWTIIHAPNGRTDSYILPPFDDVLRYLMDLQTRGYELDENIPLPLAVLRDMKKWYFEYCGASEEDESIYQEAESTLIIPSPGEALLGLTWYLIGHDVIPQKFKQFGDMLGQDRPFTAHEVCIDPNSNVVFIPKSELSIGCKITRVKLDGIAATDDLIKSDRILYKNNLETGWIVSKKYWDESVEKWEKIIRLTASKPVARILALFPEERELRLASKGHL